MAWLHRGQRPELSRPDPPEHDGEDSPERLRERIAQAVRFINRNAGQLPGVAVVRARLLTDTLLEIVDTATVRPLDIYAVLSVGNTLEDYLPTTVQRYLAVPEVARDATRSGGRTPTESLLEQLDALQVSASSVLLASQNQDVDALMTQGAFLRTKFSGSDLDL